MKEQIIIPALLILIICISGAHAEDTGKEQTPHGWTEKMTTGINLTQTSFDNWAQGGEDAIAWQTNLNFNFTLDREKTQWTNSGKFSYGSTKTGDEKARKSIDEIKLETVLTYKLSRISPYLSATAESQFAPGYSYREESRTEISAFMDPAYFREAAGAEYQPNELIKTRFGFSLKQTVTSDHPVPYADDPETSEIEKTRSELGAESVTDLNWKIAENTLLTSKLELFSTFEALDQTDVQWDNVLTVSISKYFNVNINFKLFYDKDISSRRQIKQTIALGFTYNLL